VKKRLALLLEALIEFAARHVRRLLMVLGLLLLAWLIVYGDSEIRTDLRYALAKASAQLSPLLVAYETAGEFNASEVLELNRPEIQQAVDAWPTFHSSIYLQVLNQQEKVQFDSRSRGIASYRRPYAFSSNVRYGSWRKGRPFLYVDWDPSREGRWIVRAAVTSPAYFKAHAWRLAPLLVLLIVFGKLVLISGEVRRRRRFDRLVGSMPNLLRKAQAEETLIQEVPQIIAHMLDFDSVAVYLLEGEHIVPKAYHSKAKRDRDAFQRSTTGEPILIRDDDPESRAIRENKRLVHSPQASGEVAESRPYVIVPIRRGGDGAPVGLLTAQRHAGLEEQHCDFLQSCAEIVALLLEKVRGRKAFERIYRKMIQNTRIETLGTVVPFITHNMKTPLVVVEGLAESIGKDFGSLDHVEVGKRVLGIKAQTHLCFELIRSISQYNKLGNTPASIVSVQEGLARVCGFFSGYYRIKNIELVEHYQEGFEPSIAMEELDFVQVITNLLINADDAFSEMRKSNDKRMSRDHMKIEVALESEGQKARILIADNGPGIPDRDVPRVFEEHFTTKDFGTGVGLPYCRRVVEEAGGNIDITSCYGVGTTVSILLPTKNEGGSKR